MSVEPTIACSQHMHSPIWHDKPAPGQWVCGLCGVVFNFASATPSPTGDARREQIALDNQFVWRVPRHPTDAMIDAGLYHCSADMTYADLFTAFHYMVDEAQQDDQILALVSPPNGDSGLRELHDAMAVVMQLRRISSNRQQQEAAQAAIEVWYKYDRILAALKPHESATDIGGRE